MDKKGRPRPERLQDDGRASRGLRDSACLQRVRLWQLGEPDCEAVERRRRFWAAQDEEWMVARHGASTAPEREVHRPLGLESDRNAARSEDRSAAPSRWASPEPRRGLFNPPREWLVERLATIQTVLERRTERSALLLRKLLGPIRMEPMTPDIGRSYYRALSDLDALAIVENDPDSPDLESGSTALRWWRRRE